MNMEVSRCGNRIETHYIIKNPDGTEAGRITITKTDNKKKKKRLNYNFKSVSNQIMMSKTSVNAKRVASKARGKLALLRIQLKNSEYDQKELEIAIEHAEKLERVARKRMKHLQQEEELTRKSGLSTDELKEENEYTCLSDTDEEKIREMNEKAVKELMKELERLMKETMKSMGGMTGLDDLSDEIIGAAYEDMDSEDLDEIKRKHRADELREIMEADMKYLKALFGKLAKEKQEASSGVRSGSESGVSLDIGGVEVPACPAAEAVIPEGGSVDVSV